MIDYGKYTMTQREKKKYYSLTGAALFALGFLFYHNILISALSVLCAIPLRHLAEDYLARKRREELSSQFRDLLYNMSASVAAGRQLPEALEESGTQMEASYGKDAILCREIRSIVQAMRESREDLDTLLSDFARRSNITEIRQFVQICGICQRTGGDLEQVMGKTAGVLMEKISVRREIQMLTAQKRLEANILTAMPIGMVLVLNVLSPDYLKVLYITWQGRLIMTAALGVMAFSLCLSRKITEIAV